MCKSCEKKAPKFDVPPFAGKNYDKNSGKCGDDSDPCAICGKPVKEPWPHRAVVIAGGAEWGDLDSDENDGGYMGCWPIGSDCFRKHLTEE